MRLSMTLLEYPLDKSISVSFSILKRNIDISETKQKQWLLTYQPIQICVYYPNMFTVHIVKKGLTCSGLLNKTQISST